MSNRRIRTPEQYPPFTDADMANALNVAIGFMNDYAWLMGFATSIAVNYGLAVAQAFINHIAPLIGTDATAVRVHDGVVTVVERAREAGV